MIRKSLAIGTGWLLVLLLVGCSRTTPEQQLRKSVAALQVAIASRDTGSIKTLLADDFIGPDGLDRNGAVRLAQAMFLQHRDIGATLGPLQVTLSPATGKPDHATVEFTAALTGGSGAMLPDSARIYDVRTGWRLQDGDWRMTSADWKPAL